MTKERIGHYELGEKIGSGGYGVVYKALDTHLQRPVALKFLKTLQDGKEKVAERFLREARAMAAITHPNVVTIHEIRKVDDRLCICLEYIDGETLEARLKRDEMSARETVELAIALLSALEALHAKQIVHRDIKPANIMLSQDGIARLMDFGIAIGPELKQVTAEGCVSGTVGYMSPEQLRGKGLGPWSDLFSLGAVLYECLTGSRPFPGDNASECVAATLTDEPMSIRKTLPGLSSRLDRTILRSLHKDPAKRFSSATEMREAFEAILHEMQNAADPGAATRKRRRQIQMSVAAVLLLTVGLLLGRMLVRSGGTAAPTGPLELDAQIIRVVYDTNGEIIGRSTLGDQELIRNDDVLFFEARADRAYHLYVFYRDSLGQWTQVHPGRDENPLPGGHFLRIPQGQQFRVNGPPGEERIWFVASTEPFTELEAELRKMAQESSGEAFADERLTSARQIVLRGLASEPAEGADSSDSAGGAEHTALSLLNRNADKAVSIEHVLIHVDE